MVDLLDPPAQLARRPQRVDQLQVVVGQQRRAERRERLEHAPLDRMDVWRGTSLGHIYSRVISGRGRFLTVRAQKTTARGARDSQPPRRPERAGCRARARAADPRRGGPGVRPRAATTRRRWTRSRSSPACRSRCSTPTSAPRRGCTWPTSSARAASCSIASWRRRRDDRPAGRAAGADRRVPGVRRGAPRRLERTVPRGRPRRRPFADRVAQLRERIAAAVRRMIEGARAVWPGTAPPAVGRDRPRDGRRRRVARQLVAEPARRCRADEVADWYVGVVQAAIAAANRPHA